MSELTFAPPQRANATPAAAKETVSLQRQETNPLDQTTLRQWQLDTLTGTFAEPRIGFDFSRVAAFTGFERQNQPLLRTPIMVQRFPKNGTTGSAPCPNCPEADSTEITESAGPEPEAVSPAETAESVTEPTAPGSESIPAPAPGFEPETEAAAPEETAAAAFIVEDSAEELGPGQMKKSDFLARLRAEVTRAVEAAIEGTGRTTRDCPYLDTWFGFYHRQDSAHVERAIRRYAPETAGATTAGEYIPVIAERARRSAEVWARTGEITGIPEGLSIGVPGLGLLGGIGRLVSGIGSIFFKAHGNGAKEPDNPRAIQAELGEGRPLDSSVRSQMESAFGRDFSHVRAHTDTDAIGLSNRFNARAFTVGEHVAFGAGEYKPGTLVGDAIIAHELAHVVQQSDSTSFHGPLQRDPEKQQSLEEDSNKAAVGVVLALWAKSKRRLANTGQQTVPHLNSGLQIQRCSQSRSQRISQTDFQRQFDAIKQRLLALAPGGDQIRNFLELEIDFLWRDYENILQESGVTEERIVQAQQLLFRNLQTVRDAFPLRLRMTQSYHAQFIGGASRIPSGGSSQLKIWSREELEQIDTILRRVPANYLHNINYFVRQPGDPPRRANEPEAAASWDQHDRSVNVYDPFFLGRQYIFDDPGSRRFLYFLHEVGHSTVTERREGNFGHLPPTDWMELSDWIPSTRDQLRATYGFREEDIAALNEDKRQQARRPRLIMNRYVIFDKYEPHDPRIPQQFVHYAATYHEEFVPSDYAHSHPAEDLADSFAYYLTRREETQRLLDSSRSRVHGNTRYRNKWDYLTSNYRESLASSTTTTKAVTEPAANEVATQMLQQKSKAFASQDPLEHEADQAADNIINRSMPGTVFSRQNEWRLQYQLEDEEISQSPSSTSTTDNAVTEPAANEAASQSLIVEDETAHLFSGQMRKSDFLARLRAEVTRTVEAAITGTGRTTQDCPYLNTWFDFYNGQDSAHVERAIRRYAPETARAAAAGEYIPIIAERARRSAEVWARTGEITGIPEGLPMGISGMLGMGMAGMGLLGGLGRLVSGIGRMFFKAHDGGARKPDDPRAIQAELGEGRPLDSSVRSRMESVFGMDFSHVRTHADTTASGLSTRMNARAFTIGKHVAFGSNEYKPGTMVGDALIAHELAHVVQQGGGIESVAPMTDNDTSYNNLEADADRSAVGVAGSLWSRITGHMARIGTSVLPGIKSGLRLQRCGTARSQVRIQSFADFATLTPWRLSQVSEDEFNRFSGERTGTEGPGVEDYRRASQLAHAFFRAYEINFDIDNQRGPVGREPSPNEQRILDSLLTQALAMGGGSVQQLVSGPGGRGIPRMGASTTPTLRGKVRIPRTQGEFIAKNYQMQMLITSGLNQDVRRLDSEVAILLSRYHVQVSSSPHYTDQERRLAVFNLLTSSAPGFYHPRDDVFYLSPQHSLNSPAVQEVARHETFHLLGGREQTRKAFITRFGVSRFMHYWEAFEEGMTEYLTQESRPAGQLAPSPVIESSTSGSGSETTTVTVESGGSQYENWVRWLREIFERNPQARQLFMQAFFTGNIPASVFQIMTDNPPPPR